MSAIKRKLNFEEFKNCLEAIHHENKINYLEKNKINIDCPEKIMKNSEETKNQYQKYSKNLKVKNIMFLLKKIIRLL